MPTPKPVPSPSLSLALALARLDGPACAATVELADSLADLDDAALAALAHAAGGPHGRPSKAHAADLLAAAAAALLDKPGPTPRRHRDALADALARYRRA